MRVLAALWTSILIGVFKLLRASSEIPLIHQQPQLSQDKKIQQLAMMKAQFNTTISEKRQTE